MGARVEHLPAGGSTVPVHHCTAPPEQRISGGKDRRGAVGAPESGFCGEWGGGKKLAMVLLPDGNGAGGCGGAEVDSGPHGVHGGADLHPSLGVCRKNTDG